MDNKKNKIMTMVFIVSMLILVVSTTYAFFAPQQGGSTSTNAIVTSNTTDLLTFSINRDISFTVTQANFAENGTNQSGDATATATLTPNNKTGAATMNYYLYLNIESNPTVYSLENANEDPELMLQVFDGNNQLVTLTGLGTQKTVKGVTGYDITGVTGLKTLLDNHAISASNNTATIENWRIVITLINLDVNQNDNTGINISGRIIFSADNTINYKYWNAGFSYDSYGSSLLPNGSGLSGTFDNSNDLINAVGNAYSNGIITYTFLDRSYYIRSKMMKNIVIGHEVCIWYNNHEFCMGPNYWIETGNGDAIHQSEANGLATMNKLKNEMELNLNTSISDSDCSYDAGDAFCDIDNGNFYCNASSIGHVKCVGNGYYCIVTSNGTASCNNRK